MTLSVAIGISLLVSLTLTPMMCGWMLKASKPREQKRLRGFGRHVGSPATRLRQVTEMGAQSYRLVGVVLLGTIALNIWLYISIPKTFFPEQDTGVLMGGIQADQSISFQAMRGKLQDFMKIIRDDPAVDNVTGFTGGSRVNSGMMFIHPQATRRTQRNGAANYRPSARKTGERTGGESVPDGGTGYSRWWASVERQLPVHVVIRRPGGTARMGAENPQKTGDVAGNWRT